MHSIQFDVVKPPDTKSDRASRLASANRIAQLLVLAFENGSGLSRICQAEGDELRRRLHLLFQTASAMQAAANQPLLSVIKDTQPIGVAIFTEPESLFPIWAQVRAVIQISFGVSPLVAWRMWKNSKILKKHHPSDPHYYLTLLGVHPDFQKMGIARALLDEIHARSEAHPLSTGVYLETANSKNVTLYQHFGYHLMAHLELNGIETFIMFRPNRNE